MEWLAANWIWVLVGVLFIGTHLFGHGGHGGHAKHGGHGGHEGQGGHGGHGGRGGSGCGHGEHEAEGKADADPAGTEKPSDHRH